ncbi:GNAT family N-acetyltransferase [Gemmobacter sp.]|uniref:GNAT family N-acetyltransferase n=1 Tax=Gemmobacter sp. TaxID=1898957 RepID=UPI002AFFF231|nr:GNAT family N-acetyltransferase [Gemmobacter sp.]
MTFDPQTIAPQVWQGGGYVLSTDRRLVDTDRILRFLNDESYWGQTMTRDRLQRALDASLPMVIHDAAGDFAGFGRVVTDYATFAYLRDVFVLNGHRGRGLATWLAVVIRTHPELAQVANWLLFTRDAQGVYEKAGFRPVPYPDGYMKVPPAT